MIDEARIVAAENVAIQPRVDISVVQQPLAPQPGQPFDFRRSTLQVEARREASDFLAPADRFGGEEPEAVDRARLHPSTETLGVTMSKEDLNCCAWHCPSPSNGGAKRRAKAEGRSVSASAKG